MAEYTAEDLALIVRYDGTKSAFNAITDKSPYYGRVVFITGTITNGVTTGQAIWVSETGSTSGKFLDMSNIDDIATQLTYVKGLKVGSTTYAGSITIAGSNGISVSASSSNGVVTFTFSGATLEANIATASNTANSALSKANANATLITNLGTEVTNIKNSLADYATDDELNNAIAGVVGTAEDDTADMTLHGVREYALAAANTAKSEAKNDLLGDSKDTLDDETILGNKNAITAINTAYPVTVTEAEGSGDIAKVYTIKQGATTIGTINIPKELVVTSGSVVAGTWSGTSFTESTSGAGKAIKLTIANQTTPIYINVKDLVDVYTAKAGATEIQLAISATNEISATIVAVNGSKITDGTVTKTKLATAVQTSLGKADTAYQKPSTGIPTTDLASAVQTSLGKADNAVATIGIYIPTDDANYLSGNVGTSGTTRTINLDVKTETIGNATSNTTKKGLATAEDVAAFIKARLSVKVIS